MADYIIIIILLILAALALRSSLRKNKRSGCHGNCSCCGGNCHPDARKDKQTKS